LKILQAREVSLILFILDNGIGRLFIGCIIFMVENEKEGVCLIIHFGLEQAMIWLQQIKDTHL